MTIKLCIVKGIVTFNNKYLLLKKIKDEISSKNIGKWEVSGGRIEKNEMLKNQLDFWHTKIIT